MHVLAILKHDEPEELSGSNLELRHLLRGLVVVVGVRRLRAPGVGGSLGLVVGQREIQELGVVPEQVLRGAAWLHLNVRRDDVRGKDEAGEVPAHA